MLTPDFYGSNVVRFVGIVREVSNNGPMVRVRIFGVHPMDDQEKVPDGMLPWAVVQFPVTGNQVLGGHPGHNLIPDTWVTGWFADGIDCQQPIVDGVFAGGAGSTNSAPPLTPGSPSQQNPNGLPEGQVTQIPGGSNQQMAYNYFYQRLQTLGRSATDIKLHSAAIIGNLQVESGDGLAPNARNPNSSAYGIAQWTYSGDRRGRLERFPPETARGADQPFEKQLNFIWQEFNTTERRAFNALLSSTTMSDAVAAMVMYERDESWQRVAGSNSYAPNRSHAVFLRKLQKAQTAFNSFNYTGGGAPTPSTNQVPGV